MTLTPQGRLVLQETAGGGQSPPVCPPSLDEAFARGPGHGLLRLGTDEVGSPLPVVLSYWRDFAARYVSALCALPDLSERISKPAVPPPPTAELQQTAAAVPPMVGAEYLSADMLGRLWQEMDRACDAELDESGQAVQQFLQGRNKAWNLVGRVHFNLAENRKDEEAPFAFLATYTPRLSATGKAQHLPLGKALHEYAGARNRETCCRCSCPCSAPPSTAPGSRPWSRRARSTIRCAGRQPRPLQLLRDVPQLERAGVVVRMPTSWRMNRPARPQVNATVGEKSPSQVGLDALLDFRLKVMLDGETLTAAEVKALLQQTDGLALIRGQWVEVDRERLSKTLARFEEVERRAEQDGLSFGEAMRLLAGAGSAQRTAEMPTADWGQTIAGPWLAETLTGLRQPDAGTRVDPGRISRPRCGPTSRRAWLAPPACATAARRLPRRRHGARQDDPGAVAAAGAETATEGKGGRGMQAEPAGGARLAARQLGRRDRQVCTGPQGPDRASFGHASRRYESARR